jgi:hypothetical protein
MKKTTHVLRLSVILLAALFLMTACTPSAKESADAPAPSGASGATNAAKTPAPQAITSTDVLKYYKAVTLGMTKDEVAQATGLTAETAKGEYDPEGAFNYADAEGYGVYVLFNDSNKAYSKTVLNRNYARDIAPLTVKPVTEDQCGQITDGMSREDVVKLLGGDGVELSSTAAKIETVENIGPILYWANSDGSIIQVVFLPDGTVGNAMYFD